MSAIDFVIKITAFSTASLAHHQHPRHDVGQSVKYNCPEARNLTNGHNAEFVVGDGGVPEQST